MRLLWALTLAELGALALALMVLLAASIGGPGAGAQAVIRQARVPVVGLWIAAASAQMLVAGLMGGALADWLDWRRIRIELRIQQLLLFAFGLIAIIAWPSINLVLSGPAPAQQALFLAAVILLIPFAPAVGLTIAGLLHLSIAALRERDELEDAVSPGRTEPMHQPAEKEEQPEIKLEEKRRPRA